MVVNPEWYPNGSVEAAALAAMAKRRRFLFPSKPSALASLESKVRPFG
jgi:hypothetical protein